MTDRDEKQVPSSDPWEALDVTRGKDVLLTGLDITRIDEYQGHILRQGVLWRTIGIAASFISVAAFLVASLLTSAPAFLVLLLSLLLLINALGLIWWIRAYLRSKPPSGAIHARSGAKAMTEDGGS